MDVDNMIDVVVEKKKFRSYSVIGRGRFAATIQTENKEKEEKTAVLLMMKKEFEGRKFEFEKIQSQYTVKALEYEYLCRFKTYLIHTDSGETLKHKIDDKDFRKSRGAIDFICDWVKDISLGLKKIHSNGFVHLNIQSTAIVITSNNRAKIGAFEFARHSSTLNESTEYGCEAHYRPPERCVRNCGATDGEKYDVWCLAILAVESLTDKYIARKSTKVSSWPEQYAIIHKILQAPKFKKTVKTTFPKAPAGKQLEHILRLMKHILKFDQDERPNMIEFSVLLMELSFLKQIEKTMVEENMWIKKVSQNELKHKMQIMALDQWLKMGEEKTPRCASTWTKMPYGEELKDQLLLRETEQTERLFASQPPLRTNLSIRNERNFSVGSKEKRNKETIIPSSDKVLRESFSQDLTVQEEETFISKKREMHAISEMSGDNISDDYNKRSKETELVPFEHIHVQFNEDFLSEKKRYESESREIVKRDKSENATTNDLFKNTDEDSYQEKPIIAEKSGAVLTSETEINLDQNNRENKARRNSSAKKILEKVVNWSFDAAFYIGVMNHGSFIDNLSKTLTG